MGRARRKRKAKLMYKKILLLMVLLIMAISLIRTSLARYRSTAQASADVDLAYYLFREESISQDLKLESILPRVAPYEYTFLVANHDDTDRTETAIDYVIIIKTTTNLPLNFKVYDTEDLTHDLVSETETETDDDGTYFKYIHVTGGSFGYSADEQVIYKLQIEFPQQYNQAEYEGIIEYIQITVKSSQKIQS